MAGIFERLDELAGIEVRHSSARWLERAAFVFLMLMVISAPHSIAASQASWLLGLLATALRFIFAPRPLLRFRALHIALFTVFVWAFISSIFSYEPAISFDKLRGVSLFLVFFLAYMNLRRLSAVYCAAFLLILSCMVNVGFVITERVIGRGVQVTGVSAEGPLGKAGIVENDTLLTANGTRLRSPETLAVIVENGDVTNIRVYRGEAFFAFDVRSQDVLPGQSATDKLGISGWAIGSSWRAQGFFGHFTTYAEVLQVIASLLFGIIVAAVVRKRRTWQIETRLLRILTSSPVMIIALGAMLIALLLTVTRASQLAFMVSAFLIVVLSGSKKLLLAAAAVAIPVVFGGLLFLQQSRNIGLVDPNDLSTQYRLTMWRDGMRIATTDAHNLIFGVGMDSTKKHWQEWGMYAGGYLPMGHFHSTPMQLLVERGVPAVLIWLALLVLIAARLWKGVRYAKNSDEWPAFGIILGSLGALTGFFVSGLVHNNLGDGEVALVFYLTMAIGTRASELIETHQRDKSIGAMRQVVRMAA